MIGGMHHMTIVDILSELKSTAGSNAKKAILETHRDSDLLKRVLRYGLDPFTPFNVVKVPKVTDRLLCEDPEDERWLAFFEVADACATREVTGNSAVAALHGVFSAVPQEEERWMRKILKKHLAIGASTKTVNKVFPNLVPTFEVALAQKFEEKRLTGKDRVGVEPKLDGIRCFAIVENGETLLYARSGKLISNFDSTVGKELAQLGDGCYDGEIMGEDFIAIMRQAYRKEAVDVSDTYLALFDFLPLDEWKTREAVMPCRQRYVELRKRLDCGPLGGHRYLKVVPRYDSSATYAEIKNLHDEFVLEGMEGAMIKDLDAPYKFGRGPEVMKLKAFHDADLQVLGLQEGTGKHSGKLGSVLVSYNGVDVQVGSGFSDELREAIWDKPDDFVGRTIEVRYQEVTPDGSLRFPTFVCFRNDRD
jgi:DNA ligase-1